MQPEFVKLRLCQGDRGQSAKRVDNLADVRRQEMAAAAELLGRLKSVEDGKVRQNVIFLAALVSGEPGCRTGGRRRAARRAAGVSADSKPRLSRKRNSRRRDFRPFSSVSWTKRANFSSSAEREVKL